MVWQRRNASSLASSCAISTSLMKTLPLSGLSRPPIALKSVLLPDPDGPMMEIYSPRLISTLTPFNARRVSCPILKSFITSFVRTIYSVTGIRYLPLIPFPSALEEEGNCSKRRAFARFGYTSVRKADTAGMAAARMAGAMVAIMVRAAPTPVQTPTRSRKWAASSPAHAPAHPYFAQRTIMVARKPKNPPANDATTPIKSASIKKRVTTKPSRAPRHFMVPISRKRSVTDISMELAIPTVLTRSDMTISQSWRASSSEVMWVTATWLVKTNEKKAMPRKIPAAVTTERQKRILRPFFAISSTTRMGRRCWRSICPVPLGFLFALNFSSGIKAFVSFRWRNPLPFFCRLLLPGEGARLIDRHPHQPLRLQGLEKSQDRYVRLAPAELVLLGEERRDLADGVLAVAHFPYRGRELVGELDLLLARNAKEPVDQPSAPTEGLRCE